MKKFIMVMVISIMVALLAGCSQNESVSTPTLEPVGNETILWENVITESWN